MNVSGDEHGAERKMSKVVSTWAAAVVAVMLLAAGCGDDAEQAPEGLSRAAVDQIVQSAVADIERGPTATEVERMVESALADVEPELTAADVTEMLEAAVDQAALTAAEAVLPAIGVVAAPPRSSPSDYTKYFVASAIARYEATGLDATAAYYNREDSVDGEWYMFILGPDETVVSHYDPDLLGSDVKGEVGTDANGFEFWRDMITATEDGKWLAYVWQNPEAGYLSGEFSDAELKNSWVVRHDGLLFGSGWYVGAEDFMKAFVGAAVDAFAVGGVEGVIDYFSSDELVFSGLAASASYYYDHFGWDGLAFTADPDGTFLLHTDPLMVGQNLEDVFGDAEVTASTHGNWVTATSIDSAGQSVSLRAWVVDYDGHTIGAGWRDVDSN